MMISKKKSTVFTNQTYYYKIDIAVTGGMFDLFCFIISFTEAATRGVL